MNIEQLKAALKLDNIRRFSTHWVLRDDRVSQHSFRAALLYIYLGGTEVAAMLTHDAPESVTGDLPSPVKPHLKGLEAFDYLSIPFVSATEKRVGKLADKLDLVLFLKDQLNSVGKLPDRLMTIYEEELEKVLDIAKELGKTGDVRKLLKETTK